ncbi:rieske [2Fe-2S] domain protein [Burkholderia pseudomallei]|uniref:aromatic ring-hydroxylating oxygenase subunit alpha n=1 Tax=Burkholderia pseudomallei TaxID=28450 RepID=UPI00050F5DEC|nr:Rieske 2Fe-2S domain-containing protein [Burkholderia pseudomallei]KGC69232.1 rieske [2Fe-2S] domain protein [Burkholderia pseudomallei]
MNGTQRFPMDIPFGWFCIGYSDEVAVGDVKPLRYFGKDLVMFRGESGEIGVLDAYCPHLGAHMGHGGTVEGDSLRCPFHHWAYRKDGFCTSIPYAKEMPLIAKREPIAVPYPVVERNGAIWVWHHPQQIAPTYEVLEHEEFVAPGWSKPVRRFWSFASNPQEIAENSVDTAHFKCIHHMDAMPEGEVTYEGHIRRSRTTGETSMIFPDGVTRTVETGTNVINSGAGQKISRFTGFVTISLMEMATPVEADQVELRFCFAFPECPEGSPEWQGAMNTIDYFSGQLGIEGGDIPIWSHKIHREKPILCDGDGAIMRFRRYFEQFYAPRVVPVTASA